jgi:hypothetical protein
MASHRILFSRPWLTLWGATISLALGCGASPGPEGGSAVEPNDVRSVDRHGANATVITMPPRPPGAPGDSGDVSAVVGHWYVNRGNERFELALDVEAGRLAGSMTREGSPATPLAVEQATWDRDFGLLRFRAHENGEWRSYLLHVADGTLIGRYGAEAGARTMRIASQSGHVMGWRSETFDADIAPRVFDLVLDDGRFARLRIDRDAVDSSIFTGELKVQGDTVKWGDAELPAQPIYVRRWDGQQLVFDMPIGTVRQRFTAMVHGRNLTGSIAEGTAEPLKFTGSRANVLTYGLREKSPEARKEWQDRVRRSLYRLMMAGNPAPLDTAVTVTERPLFGAGQMDAARDDNSTSWPQQYQLSDVVFAHTLPNPSGSDPLIRRGHGFLAVPTEPPPADGYSVVLSLNGHGGSAQQQVQSDGIYWYGDAFARRGYVVLAIDVSHRPPHESGGTYWYPADGDSPETGNHAHPAIAAPGFDSDWAENGERVWDAMRGIDFLLSQPSVNPNRIIVTGLSMGGEITELVAALDPRVTIAIAASAPPDLALMPVHGNHGCWQWTHGNATEFIEMSDFLALAAPRRVVLESGKWDYTYSSYTWPYAVEKENAWRARIAYGTDATNLLHYIHQGDHQYRVGDSTVDSPYPAYIQVPQQIAPPVARKRTIDWELDGETVSIEQTLFDYLAR